MPPANRSAVLVCVGWHSRQQVGHAWFQSGPCQTQDHAPPAAMAHHELIQMRVYLLIRQRHGCNQGRQELLFCLSLTIGKASSTCFCLRPTCEASGCYAVRIPISSQLPFSASNVDPFQLQLASDPSTSYGPCQRAGASAMSPDRC